MNSDSSLDKYVPARLRRLPNPARDLPRLAKDPAAIRAIEAAVRRIPTRHGLCLGDSRRARLPAGSVHLILTSPPYWKLKEYHRTEGQLGWIQDYDSFLGELDDVWRLCHSALAPGGRLVCVVGDVCLARRRNDGRHTVVPLHASIQERCRSLGFDNLTPIIWHKIASASHEARAGAPGFLGKPYEPNAVIKNDMEFILMQRKPSGYRRPTLSARVLSLLPEPFFRQCFRQVWTDIGAVPTRNHPAPYPVALAERLIRMFSFVGDTVFDPFTGTASTQVAAACCGRNSLGVEVDPTYFQLALDRFTGATTGMPADMSVCRADGDAGQPSPTWPCSMFDFGLSTPTPAQ